MLDVMLIDDDKVIRDYLRDVIEWDKLQLRLVCEASDGIAAWELYSQYQPKIVIADINIPFLSGMELAKKITQKDPEVRIIIITGYGDFEDVRQSLSLGAIDLLSKPINPGEINGSLQKAVEDFNRQRQFHRTEQALNNLLSENQALLQERCVAQLLTKQSENSEDALRSQLELLHLDFPGRFFAAALIRLEPVSGENLSIAVFPTAFKTLCDAAFAANGFQAYTYYGERDVLSCMVGWDSDDGIDRMETMLSKLLEETRFYFQAGFSASIGSQVGRLRDLYLSAQQAQMATKFQDDDCRGVVSYRNISKLAALAPIYDKNLVSLLLENARGFRRAEVKTLLDTAAAQMAPDPFRELAAELLSHLGSTCFQAGLYPWGAVNYPNTIAQIFGAPDTESVKEILLRACEQLIDLLYQQRTQSKNQLIHQAKTYICQNLHDPDLSLDTVSSHIGLSKIYFCQLFSKEEDISFNTYLNNERIALAKTLLRTSSKKVAEISIDVGYSSPKYFNYVFKHTVGKTPLEYRNELEQQKQ